MNLESMPWRDGVTLFLAAALLKILWDAVYRKIPRESRQLRELLIEQNDLLKAFQHQNASELQALKEAIDALTIALESMCRCKPKPAARRTKKPRT